MKNKFKRPSKIHKFKIKASVNNQTANRNS